MTGTIVALAVSTAALAGIYALVNIGFVLLYRTTGVLNFAQGEFMLVAALLMTTLISRGISYWPGLLITCVALGIIGAATYSLLIRHLIGADHFPKVVTTLMVSVFLVAVTAMVWGVGDRSLPRPVDAVVEIGRERLPALTILNAGLAALVVILLLLFVQRSVSGIRMRALATNETLAVYAGVHVHRLARMGWIVSSVTAGIAGVVYAGRAGVNIQMPLVAIGAFPAVIIGGLNSIRGVLPGAVIVAIIQTVTAYYFSAVWAEIATYVLMLAILVYVPLGLFGTSEKRRL